MAPMHTQGGPSLASPSGPPINFDPSFSEYLNGPRPPTLAGMEAPALQFMRSSRKRTPDHAGTNPGPGDVLGHPMSASSSHDSSRASPFNSVQQPGSGDGLKLLPVPPFPLTFPTSADAVALGTHQQMTSMWASLGAGVPGLMASPAELSMLEPTLQAGYDAVMVPAPNSQPISADQHHGIPVEPSSKHRRTVSSPSIWDAQQNALNCAALGVGLPTITDHPSTGGHTTASSLNSSPVLPGPQPQITSGGFNNNSTDVNLAHMPLVHTRQPGSPSISTSHPGSNPNTGPLDAYGSDPGPHSGTTTTTTTTKHASANAGKENTSSNTAAAVKELLAEIPASLQPVVLAKVTQKGKGGRQPAADPRAINPDMDPRQVKRILANRQSAARSKMKQRVMLETLRINKEVLTQQQDSVKEEVTRLTKLVAQLQARNQELEGQLQAANMKQQMQQFQVQHLQAQQHQQLSQQEQQMLLLQQRQRRQTMISSNGGSAQANNNWQMLSMHSRVPAAPPVPTSLPTDIGWAAPTATACDMRSSVSLDVLDLDKWWDGPMDL